MTSQSVLLSGSKFYASENKIIEEDGSVTQTDHRDQITHLIYLNSKCLATGSLDKTVKIWERVALEKSLVLLETIALTHYPITCLSAFHKTLCIADQGGNLFLLRKNQKDYELLFEFSEDETITKIAYSIEDLLIFAGTEKGSLHLYIEEEKKLHKIQTLELHHPPSDIVFHQYHSRVAVAIENKIMLIEKIDTLWKKVSTYQSPFASHNISNLKICGGHNISYTNNGQVNTFNIDDLQNAYP